MFSIDMYSRTSHRPYIPQARSLTTSDPHFDSLQFIASAGDWAPDNRRFVFAALHAGQPVLTIVDTNNGNREGEYEFKDLGEIYNPAFSPDGKQIAFSAEGRRARPVRLHARRGALQQLTNDPFADLDPEWTPTARDRVGHRSFLVEPRHAVVRQLSHRRDVHRSRQPRATGRDSIRAQFESGVRPDGSLYFLGTPDGIPNVYRCRTRCAAARRRASPT
jgi:hypothetical protein